MGGLELRVINQKQVNICALRRCFEPDQLNSNIAKSITAPKIRFHRDEPARMPNAQLSGNGEGRALAQIVNIGLEGEPVYGDTYISRGFLWMGYQVGADRGADLVQDPGRLGVIHLACSSD